MFKDITTKPLALRDEPRINWKKEATFHYFESIEEYNAKIDELEAYPTVKYSYLTQWQVKTNRCFFKRYALNYGCIWCNTDRTHEIYVCSYDGKKISYDKYCLRCAKSDLESSLEERGQGGRAFDLATAEVNITPVKDRESKLIIDSVCEVNGSPIVKCARTNGFVIPREHVFKADYSSAYPSNAFDIPTFKGHKNVKGFVEPTEDYPFAFHNNGELIIREKDGTIIRTSQMVSPIDDPDFAYDYGKELAVVEKPMTILMKRDETDALWKFVQRQYEVKQKAEKDSQDYLNAKMVLNAMIGFMRSYKYNIFHYCGYISAVIYLRHLNNMTKTLQQLKGQRILSILTDSIIWQGTNIGLDSKKTLGKLVLEEEEATCAIRNLGQYCFFKEDGTMYGLHNMGYQDEIKKYITTLRDFREMDRIAEEHSIKTNLLVWNKLTRKYERGI